MFVILSFLGIDDMFVIMQSWNNSEAQAKQNNMADTRDLPGMNIC